jgi:DNA polymerase I-like protein with 3'-5' exonuclease and polymerase domains
MGLYRVWDEMKDDGLQILGQVHDAILGQFPIGKEAEIIPKILARMENPLEIKGRQMIIPSDCETGLDWKNMKKWKPHE